MKKFLALFVVFVIALSTAVPVSALDGKVTYSGNAGEFIFEPGSKHSPTDLFPDFKGVMPGDRLTQKVTVKNNAEKEVKVKIYLRALGAHEDSEDFLSELHLQVQKSENNEMAYMFDAAASETAQLSDKVCLGTLYSGGEVNLNVILSVPTELSNEYQSKIGYLDWEFTVEEFPVEEEDPKPPQTGDESDPILWFAIMCVSLSALIILFVWRKKNKEKKRIAVKR